MAFSTVDVLKLAKQRIKKGWTKRVRSTDIRGRGVDPRDPSAIKFCMIGAIDSVDCGPRFMWIAKDLLQHVLDEKRSGAYIAAFNDAPGTSRNDVLKVFNLAIKKARAKLKKSRARAKK